MMSLALVTVRRDRRFDPFTRRALGFTRCAGRKGQFDLAIFIAAFVLLILSLCGHLPAPDYLPVTSLTYRLGLDPRGCTIMVEGLPFTSCEETSLAFGRVLRTTTPAADFRCAVDVSCKTFSSDGIGAIGTRGGSPEVSS